MTFINSVPDNLGLSSKSGALTTTVTDLVKFPAQLYGWQIYNSNAAATYLQLFNDVAANITLGTTVPFLAFGFPATSNRDLIARVGVAFSTAISFAFTTTRAGLTANSSSVDYNLFYY